MRVSRRIPEYLDDRHERAYLTLVAKADARGLVANCPWIELMDYAGCGDQAEITAVVEALVVANLVQIMPAGKRSRQFLLTGNFTQDLEAARRFVAANMGRVNNRQNARAQLRNQHKLERSHLGASFVPPMIIESLEPIERKNETDWPKWRFDVRIPGFGFVRHCIYIASPDPFVDGPNRRYKNNEWLRLVAFEPEVKQALIRIVSAAIEEAAPRKGTA